MNVRAEDEGCWILAPDLLLQALCIGIIFKGAEQEQLLLKLLEALQQEDQGLVVINGGWGGYVPLEVNIYLVSLLGSLVLSSLPSL